MPASVPCEQPDGQDRKISGHTQIDVLLVTSGLYIAASANVQHPDFVSPLPVKSLNQGQTGSLVEQVIRFIAAVAKD